MKRGYLASPRLACRARWTRANARTPGLGLWVAVLIAQVKAAMEVAS